MDQTLVRVTRFCGKNASSHDLRFIARTSSLVCDDLYVIQTIKLTYTNVIQSNDMSQGKVPGNEVAA